MVAMIGIAPLQYPTNSAFNFAPVVNSLLDYRRASDEAADQQAIQHAGTLSPEEGYRYLMAHGLPEQARAMSLFPLQRQLQELQGRYIQAHATQAEAQTGLTNEQAAALRTQQGLNARVVNALFGIEGGPSSGDVTYTPGHINPGSLTGALNPLFVPPGFQQPPPVFGRIGSPYTLTP